MRNCDEERKYDGGFTWEKYFAFQHTTCRFPAGKSDDCPVNINFAVYISVISYIAKSYFGYSVIF